MSFPLSGRVNILSSTLNCIVYHACGNVKGLKARDRNFDDEQAMVLEQIPYYSWPANLDLPGSLDPVVC